MDKTKQLLEASPFWKIFGLKILEMLPNHASIQMEIKPDFYNPGMIAHGGVASSIIDSAIAVAIWPTLGPDEFPTTIDMNVHYLKPVRHGTLVATADIIQRGRKICVGKVIVTNGNHQVAFGTATYMVVAKPTD